MYQTRQNGYSTTKPRIRVRVIGRYTNREVPLATRLYNSGLFDEQFECQLPPEIRAELKEEPSPRFYIREAPPTYQPVQAPPAEAVFRPPPVSPPTPPVMPPTAKPVQRASRNGSGIWSLLAALLGFPMLIAMLSQAVSTLTIPISRPVNGTQHQSGPVEVRRALPPPVEVRRALPAVPRALPVTSPVSTFSNAEWQPIRMPDGTIVQASYQGELPSSAALPPRGRFIGEEWSTGNTSWIWMTPAGANFPSWVDP